jgi:hypothetical protein
VRAGWKFSGGFGDRLALGFRTAILEIFFALKGLSGFLSGTSAADQSRDRNHSCQSAHAATCRDVIWSSAFH